MHSKKIDEIFENLKTNRNGITSSEADLRLKENGKNILEKSKKKSLVVQFFEQFKNVMVIILLISALISISIAVVHKDVYELIEGIVILFIVIMNSCIGVFQENKAQACLEELEKKTATHSLVIRDGKEMLVLSEELVVGDIIKISAGDVVSADIRIIDSTGLTVDESSLTGESTAVEKEAGILSENTALAERKNMLFSSSLIATGKALGVVTATGNGTELGKIAKLLITGKKESTPLQKTIQKIGKFITIIVLSVCVVIFFLEIFFAKDTNFVSALMTAVALAVAGIPESLPAVITLIMALGVQQLARRKVIIKHLHAVETLGCCEIICTDKTGTLTQNKMEVVEIFPQKDDTENFKQLINCMYLCNEAVKKDNQIVAEPTEKAIFEYASQYYDGISRPRIDEIAFNSKRKMMSTINDCDCPTVFVKGAFDKVIKKCSRILVGGEIREINSCDIENLTNQCNNMAERALRVLAFCFKPHIQNEEVESNLIFLGLAGLRDEPRKEAKSAIEKCLRAGMKPVMITGDHALTAFAIAKELKIAKSFKQVITGEELSKMSDQQLVRDVQNYTVFARVTAEHKMKIVSAYKHYGKIVAMTGDGVNDAPSLKIADIGVGMGQSGTEVAKSVADMIITDDNFNSIIVAVEEGRKVYSNIQKALQYLMSTNAVEIFGMLFALLFFPNYTFLLPSQMLFINLVTDSLPAFALGMENVEPSIMNKPPRKVKTNILADEVGVGIVYQAILQLIIVTTVYCTGIRLYTPNIATTMVFFTIIWLQLLHSINCKTNQSIFSKNLVDNKTFNICFLITFVVNLAVCVLPFAYFVFNLEVLNFSQWMLVVLSSISIIPACEVVKFFLNSNFKFKIAKNVLSRGQK